MSRKNPSVILIGAGIMSATLAVLLRKLLPQSSILILERLDTIAAESSDALNNAGTGHSAFCELNYTPEKDGKIDIGKAKNIASSFEISKEFWTYLLDEKYIRKASSFINPVPHISFVWGDENVAFLKKRYETMNNHPLFDEMEYTEDWQEMVKWMPLVIQGRDKSQKIAATKMHYGTDVNFGALTRITLKEMERRKEVDVELSKEVIDIEKQDYGTWKIRVKDLIHGEEEEFESDFVFVGAGGGALTLLDKSGIKEIEGYGGFPISGQWLICKASSLAERHEAKV
ncbi:MAG: hypothetical protein RLZZ546_2405, partial [Bacteroidota bacterium]